MEGGGWGHVLRTKNEQREEIPAPTTRGPGP